MPSPFPGMDPYFEGSESFVDFHRSFIVFLRGMIQPLLPSRYYAALEFREWLELGEHVIVPDAVVRKHAKPRPAGVGTAVRPIRQTRPLVIDTIEVEEQRREAYVSIYRKRARDRQLITSIELLSPSNKRPGSEGRELYVRKQQELLESGVNLVEIDLLRGGKHVTAIPEAVLWERAGNFDYHVCATRGDQLGRYFTYPFMLEDPLPAIAIPLAPKDEDVPVDLQQVMDGTYDSAGYDRHPIHDDIHALVPPVASARFAWIKRQLGRTRR